MPMKMSMKSGMKMKSAMKMKSVMKMASSSTMKTSKIARGKLAKRQVFDGKKSKTSTGMTADDLKLSKYGRVVSKKKSAQAKKRYDSNSGAKKWIQAVTQAKKDLGITGFAIVGGSTPQGQKIYNLAKEYQSGAKKKGFFSWLFGF